MQLWKVKVHGKVCRFHLCNMRHLFKLKWVLYELLVVFSRHQRGWVMQHFSFRISIVTGYLEKLTHDFCTCFHETFQWIHETDFHTNPNAHLKCCISESHYGGNTLALFLLLLLKLFSEFSMDPSNQFIPFVQCKKMQKINFFVLCNWYFWFLLFVICTEG